MKTTIFVAVIIGVIIGYAWSYQANVVQHREANAFSQVPTAQVHTMRVYEDGSYNIEYQDNTSERGCLPGGLCND